MSRLTSTSVYLEDAQLTRLREVSSALRRPMAGLIREAIADWLLEREASAVDSELLAAQATKRTALARDEGQEKGAVQERSKESSLLESGHEGRLLNVNPD